MIRVVAYERRLTVHMYTYRVFVSLLCSIKLILRHVVIMLELVKFFFGRIKCVDTLGRVP